MNGTVRFLGAALAPLLLTSAFAPTAPAAPASWAPAPVPAMSGDNGLWDTAALGAREVWTVGVRDLPADPPVGGPEGMPFSARWDGAKWTSHPVPGKGGLTRMHARTATDVWAVHGGLGNSKAPDVLRWNGTRWTSLPVVKEATRSWLHSVYAVSATDVWAVGEVATDDKGGSRPAAQHWDGRKWTVVAVPRTGATSESLQSVHGSGPKDLWAVGSTSHADSSGNQDGVRPFTLHWDGTRWSRVTLPTSAQGALTGVYARGASDVVTTGWNMEFGGGGSPFTAVSYRWNGRSWSAVEVGDKAGALLFYLNGNDKGLWASGYRDGKHFVAEWAGTSWRSVSTGLTKSGELGGVSAAPGSTELWTVGFDSATERAVVYRRK